MKPNIKQILAYCAGVIDSDGTIGIKKSTYGIRRFGDRRQPSHEARICVRQVERGAVDLLAVTFGGGLRINKAATPARRHLYEWTATNAVAERALVCLLPFLRIKKAQAENCLELRRLIARCKIERNAKGRGHIGGKPRTAEMAAAIEAVCQKAHDLNKVGPR